MIDEDLLAPVDDAVRWGEKYGIHVNIGFHRGPGFCIHDRRNGIEPFNLWTDDEALNCFILHWVTFAKRYRAESVRNVSFNMLNESAGVSPEAHAKVMRAATRAIHEISPERICIVDGLGGGNYPMCELGDLAKENVAQSCRGYIPSGVSHYRASWVDRDGNFPYPVWPGGLAGSEVWSAERLDNHYKAWAAVAQAFNMGVHCGEGGSNRNCPHDVGLRWLDDVLNSLKTYNIGYAQWEFTGNFGIIDSQRSDVEYRDYRGHKLDQKMLDIINKYR
jgi:endoglucanase